MAGKRISKVNHWAIGVMAMVFIAIVGRPGAEAATLHVCPGCLPPAYSSIQNAINAANPYDVVLIHDGIYQENINFGGEAILVRSVNGPAVTIIDGGAGDSVVKFISGEGPDSELRGFTIKNGSASYGGGILCQNSSSPAITDCIIHHNLATDSGGGIHCEDNSSPTISNCDVVLNSADHLGGGIHCRDSSSPTISKCTISKNVAFDAGGGVYCDDSSSEITNCTISGNRVLSSGGGGAGIYLHSSSPMITNCTISHNWSGGYYGGAISCVSSSLATVINSILWMNVVPQGGYGREIYITSSTVNLYYSDITGLNSPYVDIPGNGTLNQSNNINVNPSFVDPTNGDYHLQYGSPCIDVGTDDIGTYPTLPSDDIDGHSRPQPGIWFTLPPYQYDMGSDEYVLTLIPALDNTISGFVTGPDDYPIFGAWVNLMQGEKQVASTFSDDNGHYEFSKLADGIYRVVAGKQGYTRNRKPARIEQARPWGKEEFINLILRAKKRKRF